MFILQLVLPSLILIVVSIMDILSHSGSEQNEILSIDVETSDVEQEQNALAQIRISGGELLKEDDFYQTDVFLLQWLKAKNFDVQAVLQMVQKAKEWKIKNRINLFLNETILTFPRPYYTYDGFDKKGRPRVFLADRIDARKLQLTAKHEDFVRFYDQIMERGYQIVKNIKQPLTGKPVTGLTGLFDASGLTLKQHMCFRCVPAYVECVRNMENYYPGIAELIIIVNMNRFMEAHMNLVTPLISTQTLSSLKLFGTNRTEWTEYLLSIIPTDQLQRRFGGTRLDF